jgi:hypothetical protein
MLRCIVTLKEECFKMLGKIMFLNQFALSKIFIVVGVFFVFTRIYQHNLVIKLNYEYQRLEKKRSQLEKQRNELLMELFEVQDPDKVLALADHCGMVPLKVSQVITLTTQPVIDFLSTYSSETVLQRLGLVDSNISHSGGSYVSTRL